MFGFKNDKNEPGYKGNLNLEHTKSRNTFIGRNGPKLPDNFRYDQSKERNKMKSVTNSDKPKEDYPDRVGEVKSETGKIEIGYDSKNKEAVITDRDWSMDPTDNIVDEATATEKTDRHTRRFKSNDKDFEKSTVSFRLKGLKDLPIGKLKRISNTNDYKSIVDKSQPFIQTKFNDKKIKQLKYIRSRTNGNESEIDKEISEQQKIISQKQLKEKQFKVKFKMAMDDVRTRSLMTFSDYVVYIRRRLEEIQSTSDDDNNNNNNNNKDNADIEQKDDKALEQSQSSPLEESVSQEDIDTPDENYESNRQDNE